MSSLSIAELIRALSQIEQDMGGSKSRNPRASIINSIRFLSGHKDQTVASLLSLLSEKPAKSPTKKKPVPVRTEIVDKHLAAMKGAGLQPEQFTAAVDALKADKMVRAAELRQIVKEFVGSTANMKSKAVGWGLIEQKFDREWKRHNR